MIDIVVIRCELIDLIEEMQRRSQRLPMPESILRGLKQKELVPIFKTESIVSDILGVIISTTRHIQELSAYFHLSPAVLSQRYLAYLVFDNGKYPSSN